MTAGTGARELRRSEKRAVALLGVPTLALALTSTLVTTYTPVVAREFVESSAVIGMIIGLEGLVALWLPLVVGVWSDRLDTKLGGRLPFLLAATPLVIGGLVAMAVMGSVAVLAVAAFVFFAGYFIAYEPYRALYPDAVGEEVAGRAQATQAVWRGVGTGLALMGGGLLLAWGQAAPFVAGAIVYAVAIGAFSWALIRSGVPRRPRNEQHAGMREVFALVRGDQQLKAFLAANALWELSLAALKTFVVLYVTRELGFSQTESSLIIGGVAVLVLGAALASGPLADRYGSTRVLRVALPIHGVGFLVPLLFQTPWIVTPGGAVHRPRRRRDHGAALRRPDPADARQRARRPDGLLLRLPRHGHLARPAAGRHRRGRRRRLPRRVGRMRGGHAAEPVAAAPPLSRLRPGGLELLVALALVAARDCALELAQPAAQRPARVRQALRPEDEQGDDGDDDDLHGSDAHRHGVTS